MILTVTGVFVLYALADIRDIDGPRRDQVVAVVLKSAEEIADKRNVRQLEKGLVGRAVGGLVGWLVGVETFVRGCG